MRPDRSPLARSGKPARIGSTASSRSEGGKFPLNIGRPALRTFHIRIGIFHTPQHFKAMAALAALIFVYRHPPPILNRARAEPAPEEMHTPANCYRYGIAKFQPDSFPAIGAPRATFPSPTAHRPKAALHGGGCPYILRPIDTGRQHLLSRS
jgi:hypothetical protein